MTRITNRQKEMIDYVLAVGTSYANNIPINEQVDAHRETFEEMGYNLGIDWEKDEYVDEENMYDDLRVAVDWLYRKTLWGRQA
tara:strand:+ start:340 stop:588 length:249 start_codon:yes stop_codon:yes gene_type:complete